MGEEFLNLAGGVDEALKISLSGFLQLLELQAAERLICLAALRGFLALGFARGQVPAGSESATSQGCPAGCLLRHLRCLPVLHHHPG